MELTGVLVLSLISLIHATPHDYGGSHVIAGAGAVAGAFSGAGVNPENVNGGYSGSFSKSSASSFASSSASSSSSSFGYSGSGSYPAFGSNGVNEENGKNGCTSGNCANGNGNDHSGDAPQHSSNGYGGLGSVAGAIASAGAFASAGSAIPFNGGSLNEPGCSGPNCKPSTSNNECTSGFCEKNNDIQVNSHYKSKTTSSSQSNNPPKNNPGTICTSGTCGPLNSDRKEPYDQSPQGHNDQNTAIRPTSPSRVPAQWSSNSGSNDYQSDTEQESSKDNCANGVCGKPLYEGPSSYNVPIQPTGTVPSNNCKNGDCGQHEPKPNIPRGDVSSCTSGNCKNEKEPEYDNTYSVFTSSVPKKGSVANCSSPGCKSYLGQNSPQNNAQAESPKPIDESFSPNNNGNYKPANKPIYSSFNLNSSPVQAPTLNSNTNFKPADTLQAPFDQNSAPSCNNGNCKPVIKPIQSNYNSFPAPQNFPSKCSPPGCQPAGAKTPNNNGQSDIPKFVPLDQNVSPNCYNGNCKPLIKPIQSNYNPASAHNAPYSGVSISTTNCVGLNCPSLSPTFSQPQASKPAIVQSYNPNLSLIGHPGCSNGNCFPKPTFGPPLSPAGGQGCSNGNCDSKPSFGRPLSHVGGQGCNNGNCGPKPSFGSPLSPVGGQGCSNGNCGPKPSFVPLLSPTGSQGCSNGNCGPKPSFGPPQSPVGGQCNNGNCGPKPSFAASPTGSQGCSNGNCGPKPSFEPSFSNVGAQGCINGNCLPKPSFAPPLSPTKGQGCINGNCGPKPSFSPPLSPTGGQGCINGNCGPIPRYTPPADFGNQVPTLTKPVPKKEEKQYTGGFGAPAGILKPNDYSKPSQPFVPVSNPTNNKLIAKPSSTHPPQSVIPHSPPKHVAPTLTNGNNNHNHLASSTSSEGAFASANSEAYTGGFGGPPGLLKPHDGKGALTSGNKNQLGQTGNNQGQFQNINVATAGGVLNGFGQGGQDEDKNGHRSTNCHGDQCNSSPQTSGNYPSNDGHFGINSAGSFSASGVGSYGQGHPGENGGPHTGGCNSGCSGNVKGGPQTGAYGLSSAGALSGSGSFGTSGSFATSSAVAHASAGASTKGGYGRR